MRPAEESRLRGDGAPRPARARQTEWGTGPVGGRGSRSSGSMGGPRRALASSMQGAVSHGTVDTLPRHATVQIAESDLRYLLRAFVSVSFSFLSFYFPYFTSNPPVDICNQFATLYFFSHFIPSICFFYFYLFSRCKE